MAAFNATLESSEQHLKRLVEKWHRAIASRDTAALDAIWDESYLSTGPDGKLITKEQELASVAASDLTFHSLIADVLAVRVYGETAVVLGRSLARGKYQGQDVSGEYRFTTVFRHGPDGWRAVVSHGTQVLPG